MGLAGGVVAATEHDRFDRAIQFRDGDLQSHLHRVKAQVAGFPFLGGLEHQGQRHHVGAIEPLQGFDGLGVILASRPPYQGKTSQRYRGIHQCLVGVKRIKEEAVDRLGEIQAAAEHGHHASAAVFQFLDQRHVVGIVSGDDVAALQHQAD